MFVLKNDYDYDGLRIERVRVLNVQLGELSMQYCCDCSAVTQRNMVRRRTYEVFRFFALMCCWDGMLLARSCCIVLFCVVGTQVKVLAAHSAKERVRVDMLIYILDTGGVETLLGEVSSLP